MECIQAQPLIPTYLDGELSEARAAPLRRHLLDCQPCRAGAQSEKNLKRWFAAGEPVAVPRGFAARVARRALAGDLGERSVVPGPVLAPLPAIETLQTVAIDAEPGSARRPVSGNREDRLLRFVLQITAAAALVVIALSVAIRSLSLPPGTSLRAADGRNEISVEQAVERLDQLNREEARGAQAQSPARPTVSPPGLPTGGGRRP